MKKLILIFLLFSTPVFAQVETIESFDDENISTLNDSLQNTDRKIRSLESSGLSRFQTPTNDGVPIGDGTNFITTVLPGCATEDTAKLLYNSTSNTFSCGVDSDISQNNPIVSWMGSIDAVVPANMGIQDSASLTDSPATYYRPIDGYEATAGQYTYLVDRRNTNSYATLASWKWEKVSGINTLSGTLSLWLGVEGGGGPGRSGRCKIVVGTAESSEMTSASTTPASKSFSVDVSGLTNGTTYDIELKTMDDLGGGNNCGGVRIAKILIYAS